VTKNLEQTLFNAHFNDCYIPVMLKYLRSLSFYLLPSGKE